MFKPRFRYTDKIVNNLVHITSAKDDVLNAFFVPESEVSLRRDAIIRSVHASTSIEGNPLTLDEVGHLAMGKKVIASKKAKREVLNYLYVLKNIERYQRENKISEKGLLRLHKDITKGTLDNPEWEGRYRKIEVYVGNKITGEVIFTPPPAKHVPMMTKELLEWLNSGSLELNPVDITLRVGKNTSIC